MKRTLLAVPAALALAVGFSPAAAATEDNPTPGYEPTTTTLAAGDSCGTFTVTWDNPTEWKFWGDFRVGQQDGQPDDATGGTIEEGPLKGQPFGKTYNLTPVPAGETVSKTITLAEYKPEKDWPETVTVDAWIKRGPEQRAFSEASAPITVTSCETDTTEPTPPPSSDPTTPPPSDPSTPPADGGFSDKDCSELTHEEAVALLAEDSSDPHGLDRDNDGKPCESLSGDDDVDQIADEANEDGTAPTPEPQEDHIAVTG